MESPNQRFVRRKCKVLEEFAVGRFLRAPRFYDDDLETVHYYGPQSLPPPTVHFYGPQSLPSPDVPHIIQNTLDLAFTASSMNIVDDGTKSNVEVFLTAKFIKPVPKALDRHIESSDPLTVELHLIADSESEEPLFFEDCFAEVSGGVWLEKDSEGNRKTLSRLEIRSVWLEGDSQIFENLDVDTNRSIVSVHGKDDDNDAYEREFCVQTREKRSLNEEDEQEELDEEETRIYRLYYPADSTQPPVRVFPDAENSSSAK